MKYLVDTTIWVKYLRGLDEILKEKLTALVSEERVFTSEVIIMEILRGAKSDRDYKMLYNDFLALPQLGTNREVWDTAWKTSYKLRKNGVNIPLIDILIAATAIHYKCPLMHSDKHFILLEKHTSLKSIEV